MSYTFILISTYNEMLSHFELIQQLQPDLKKEYFEKNLKHMLLSNYRMVLVLENNKTIALSGIWVSSKLYCGKYIEMDNVVVDENYRGKGIGKILTDEVIRIGKEENCVVAMLDAYLENTGAHNFYEREGFTKKGYHFIRKIYEKK